MQELAPTGPTRDQQRYALLDRFLLYFLAAELAYLVLAVILVVIAQFIVPLLLGWDRSLTGMPWELVPYMLALPVNIGCGIAGLVLNIRTRYAGYPGTGHLLNWILIASTAWVFLLAVMLMVQTRSFLD